MVYVGNGILLDSKKMKIIDTYKSILLNEKRQPQKVTYHMIVCTVYDIVEKPGCSRAGEQDSGFHRLGGYVGLTTKDNIRSALYPGGYTNLCYNS